MKSEKEEASTTPNKAQDEQRLNEFQDVWDVTLGELGGWLPEGYRLTLVARDVEGNGRDLVISDDRPEAVARVVSRHAKDQQAESDDRPLTSEEVRRLVSQAVNAVPFEQGFRTAFEATLKFARAGYVPADETHGWVSVAERPQPQNEAVTLLVELPESASDGPGVESLWMAEDSSPDFGPVLPEGSRIVAWRPWSFRLPPLALRRKFAALADSKQNAREEGK